MRIAMAVLFFGLSSAVWGATGQATLTATSPGSTVNGTVQFSDTPAGLKVQAHIAGATPGLHGFHIHEFGACGDMGKAAGGHFNPKGTPHGMVMKDGPEKAHAGDMGNIQVDAKGEASLDTVLPGVSLWSQPTVAGRAVVLHEKTDDFSQPVGNAGARVACGPIIITGN